MAEETTGNRILIPGVKSIIKFKLQTSKGNTAPAFLIKGENNYLALTEDGSRDTPVHLVPVLETVKGRDFFRAISDQEEGERVAVTADDIPESGMYKYADSKKAKTLHLPVLSE